MKQYTKQNQLALVGKAWEIKHQLKLLAKSSTKSGLAALQPSRTLREYLQSAN
ncbi:Z-ring formation inhibitor MciZ [Paenibacillus albus]|uniref:Z-ring formation inhibitor MciZ n=1 Tax=Paenibacillus albus TaxID=2495582 RepID=A0A3Q8X504_9BACL|nr:Z-ring formation inhibitor MciZ [Paenibacillus albus]AZN40650.1 Z-ring formation inhibitor MciZ [Paenibacillus albus]